MQDSLQEAHRPLEGSTGYLLYPIHNYLQMVKVRLVGCLDELEHLDLDAILRTLIGIVNNFFPEEYDRVNCCKTA